MSYMTPKFLTNPFNRIAKYSFILNSVFKNLKIRIQKTAAIYSNQILFGKRADFVLDLKSSLKSTEI